MKPIEPDGGDSPAGNLRADVDETFHRLARARHASEAFYVQVMARAAELPPPRAKRVTAMPWFNLNLRLPRAATIALASVLLLCMAGLGHLYHRVGQMQAVIEQEQKRQPQRVVQVARLHQEHMALQLSEREFDVGELSDIVLEAKSPDAKADDALSANSTFVEDEKRPASGAESILDQVIDTLRWAFDLVWENIQRVFNPHPSPAESQPSPSQS
ncbi:MAG: hypothetical protein ETSY1_43800 [Candidatus Entotheonella factor]|uniref:Uncharacterized protein n=1 Tax=Entotheonella factor TaxID=1429438 RepID=W4L408_ENTF1|nr:MAG: hypothetical protein ETSY1_43800 [Candidatus Entotheonella factor]